MTMLELNLIGFNLAWGYEAQNRILGLAETWGVPNSMWKKANCNTTRN